MSFNSALAQLSRRRILSCLLIAALSIVLRVALLRVNPIPEPRGHDEFSYVLGAETFAKGRLTNPTHPLWRFFETYHINMQPTYASKYPPAQAAFLALGICLFGHPWYGVLISLAVMSGCICWMLQGWLSPRYAFFGGILAILQFAISSPWIDTYCGGCVAAAGGALVLGGMPRLAVNGNVSAAFAGAIGVAILANSRPFEGVVLISLVVFALLWWTRGRYRTWLRPQPVLVIACVLIATASGMAYYNWRLTGSPATFAYSVYQKRYGASPIFWLQTPYPRNHTQYRDPSMQNFWTSIDVDAYEQVRHNPVTAIFRVYKEIHDLVGGGAGVVVVFLFACALPIATLTRVRIALGISFLFLVGMLPNKYISDHYVAPGLGAFFLAAMCGVRLLGALRLGKRKIGSALTASALALAVVLCLFDSAITIRNGVQWRKSGDLGFRDLIANKLRAEPGLHLVLVRYAADHNAADEVVFNGPDIDAQKIVWAYDFGAEADRPLFDYYRDRKVWLIQPDFPNPSFEAYSGGR